MVSVTPSNRNWTDIPILLSALILAIIRFRALIVYLLCVASCDLLPLGLSILYFIDV